MSEDGVELEGASMPEGIEVDEAAAYFGVTSSSDFVIQLSQTDPLNGMGAFFSLTIDLVLQEEFDFEAAAERLGCEGGEIYYLLTGQFGLISLTDPLRRYLGQEDSLGEPGTQPNLPEHEIAALDTLNDVFTLMRMFGISHLIGGLPLLDHYLATFSSWVANPAASKTQLLTLSVELSKAIEEAKGGSISPLTVLGSPTVAPPPPTQPEAQPPATSPQPTAPAHARAPAHEPVTAPAPAPSPATAPAPAPAPAGPSHVMAAGLSPQRVESEPEGEPFPEVKPDPTPAPAPLAAPVTKPAPVAEPGPVARPAPAPAPAPVTEPRPSAMTPEPTPAPVAKPAPAPQPVPVAKPSPAPKVTPEPAVEPQSDPLASAFESAGPPVTPKRQPVVQSGQPEPPALEKKPPTAMDSVAHLIDGVGPVGAQKEVGGGVGAARVAPPAGFVHHVVQSGKNCGRCGIGVEHAWVHCPVCSSAL